MLRAVNALAPTGDGRRLILSPEALMYESPRSRSIVTLLACAAAAACAEAAPTEPVDAPPGHAVARGRAEAAPDPAVVEAIRELAARVEADVEAQRAGVAAHGAYWTGVADEGAMGGFVFFNDRGNKQLGIRYVPADPRRTSTAFVRNDIGYTIFPLIGAAAPAGLAPGDVDAAIRRGMDTWDAQTCSGGLGLFEGSVFDWLAFDTDIIHAGFVPLGPEVLGVTIPFVFLDPVTLEPSDIDADGNEDYAFAIILYNSDFSWQIDGDIDVESVALHESGHGLGQAHFGKAFLTLANGVLHFAPRAVMNAAYAGVQQELLGSDVAGHCSLFGTWPVR